MFRKTILTAALALAALSGLSLTPSTASAMPPIGHDRHDFSRFEVLVYRHGCWENAGTYRVRFEAEREARHLRARGLAVKIEQC